MTHIEDWWNALFDFICAWLETNRGGDGEPNSARYDRCLDATLERFPDARRDDAFLAIGIVIKGDAGQAQAALEEAQREVVRCLAECHAFDGLPEGTTFG